MPHEENYKYALGMGHRFLCTKYEKQLDIFSILFMNIMQYLKAQKPCLVGMKKISTQTYSHGTDHKDGELFYHSTRSRTQQS